MCVARTPPFFSSKKWKFYCI